MPLAQLAFSHFPSTHKQIGPSCCWFLCGWACVHSRTLWVSPTNSPVRVRIPIGFYSQNFWGFISLCWNPGLHGLAPQLFLPVSLHANVGLPHLPPTASPAPVVQLLPCRESSLPQLPISAPPTSLGECFFHSLVVGFSYSSIFWQFWLFLFLNLLFVLLVVWEGKVYLPMLPSWLEVPNKIL